MEAGMSSLFPVLRQQWPDRRSALPLLLAMGVLAALAWVVTLWQTRTGDVLMTAGVPMSFGALRMGAGHGAYCLGCCSGLMLALIALGAMDLRWMATVSALIAVEKLGPRHRALPVAVGIGLVLLGFAVALWPRPGMAGM
jgi:predicted metal-binding membrane protein